MKHALQSPLHTVSSVNSRLPQLLPSCGPLSLSCCSATQYFHPLHPSSLSHSLSLFFLVYVSHHPFLTLLSHLFFTDQRVIRWNIMVMRTFVKEKNRRIIPYGQKVCGYKDVIIKTKWDRVSTCQSTDWKIARKRLDEQWHIFNT